MKITSKKHRLYLYLLTIPVLTILTVTNESRAISWQDIIKYGDSVLHNTTEPKKYSDVLTTLSNDKVIRGLKEALTTGAGKAIKMLGSRDGFLNDETVRILMPDQLQQADKILRAVGQGKIMDDFITSMNRAAEQAVPEVSDIFTDSIVNMSITDAMNILNGDDTAATDFFRQTTSDRLMALIKPHIKKAMAGLFNKIAVEEKLIRQNPAARSTELLQEVFGY